MTEQKEAATFTEMRSAALEQERNGQVHEHRCPECKETWDCPDILCTADDCNSVVCYDCGERGR